MHVEKTLFLSIFSVIIFSFSCTQPTCYDEVDSGVFINELLINNTRVGLIVISASFQNGLKFIMRIAMR